MPASSNERHETVGRFGKVERLRTSHVADGQTLDLPDDSTDVAFSYITLQHCDADDALDLTSEAVRITKPGGKIALELSRPDRLRRRAAPARVADPCRVPDPRIRHLAGATPRSRPASGGRPTG